MGLRANYVAGIGILGWTSAGPSAVDPISLKLAGITDCRPVRGVICANSDISCEFVPFGTPGTWQNGLLEIFSVPAGDTVGFWLIIAVKSAIFDGNRASNVGFFVFLTPRVQRRTTPGTDRKSRENRWAGLVKNTRCRDIFSNGAFFPPAGKVPSGGTAHRGANA